MCFLITSGRLLYFVVVCWVHLRSTKVFSLFLRVHEGAVFAQLGNKYCEKFRRHRSRRMFRHPLSHARRRRRGVLGKRCTRDDFQENTRRRKLEEEGVMSQELVVGEAATNGLAKFDDLYMKKAKAFVGSGCRSPKTSLRTGATERGS